jgi:nucleotide-binding universal stress UspA family protein
LASLLLGSVSVALVAHAPCPVVIARSGYNDDPIAEQRVVVGVDGTADSAAALAFGFELASDQHRPLEVIHAIGDAWVAPASGLISAEMVEDVITDWKVLLAESLAGYREKFPDVDFGSRLVRGSASQALVLASETASTVVVGARSRSAANRWLLGSVSRAVIEHATCTAVVVRGVGA